MGQALSPGERQEKRLTVNMHTFHQTINSLENTKDLSIQSNL